MKAGATESAARSTRVTYDDWSTLDLRAAFLDVVAFLDAVVFMMSDHQLRSSILVGRVESCSPAPCNLPLRPRCSRVGTLASTLKRTRARHTHFIMTVFSANARLSPKSRFVEGDGHDEFRGGCLLRRRNERQARRNVTAADARTSTHTTQVYSECHFSLLRFSVHSGSQVYSLSATSHFSSSL